MTDDAHLTADELIALVDRVFAPTERDRAIAILVDLPDDELADNTDWRVRRRLASDWASELAGSRPRHGRDVSLFVYRNVRANNADLPERAWRIDPLAMPDHVDLLADQPTIALDEVLTAHQIALAPTELSATAPLKMMSRRIGFRAATMPGFSPAMVPALRLDYGEVNRRVNALKQQLDRAHSADVRFDAAGTIHELHIDLRHRTAHASGGLLHDPGTAGNLPSGESYIVPYEGEIDGDPSRTGGVLPVEIENEVVLHRIEHNRSVGVLSDGPVSRARATAHRDEPAAANIAELGLGVLSDFGVRPIGEVLLDEKLGLHIAFGRSEHFGGQVGPSDFTRPAAVVHQDWVYLPEIQPQVTAVALRLEGPDGSVDLIREASWVYDFG